MENKKIEELSIIELKAMLFDIDMDVKQKQHQYQQVAQVLQGKFNQKEINEEIVEGKE